MDIKQRNQYIRRKSQKQEAKTAELFGGRTQIASGALEGLKGDVRTGNKSPSFNEKDFLIENKFTDNKSYKLESKIWDKIEEEAFRDDMRIPLLVVTPANGNYYVIFDEGVKLSFPELSNLKETETIDKRKSKSFTIPENKLNKIYLDTDLNYLLSIVLGKRKFYILSYDSFSELVL